MTLPTRKITVRDLDVEGKRVLVRTDYNVPFLPGTTRISDDSRIRASLHTVSYLLQQGSRVVLCSHLGRPGGKVVGNLRLTPVARRLAEMLGSRVSHTRDCIGHEAECAVRRLEPGHALLLENLRFHPGEEKNDPEFAVRLAELADIYVNDAFGVAHRAHASTEGVARLLASAAGLLMEREIEMLGRALEAPKRPFTAVIGGAKVSDKMAVLQNLSHTVDTLIVGGGMAATFLKARGLPVGDSMVEDDRVKFARSFAERAVGGPFRLLLPTDVIVADSFAETANHFTVDVSEIPEGWRIMDIGPRSVADFRQGLAGSKTVLWNGPMGVSEWAPFAAGTAGVADTVSGLTNASTIVGGGSTAEVVGRLGMSEKMTHVSTGGGASLEFLEGKVLPGYAALPDKTGE